MEWPRRTPPGNSEGGRYVVATGVERALVFGAHPSRGERDDAQLTPARQSWAVGDAMLFGLVEG